MRKIHQAISEARQKLAFEGGSKIIKLKDCLSLTREYDIVKMYYYGLSCQFDTFTREFTVFIRGYEGKSFSQTELGYIRAFVGTYSEMIKINSQPFTYDRLKLVRA